MGRNVTLTHGGHVIYPRASITNIEGASGDIVGGNSSTGGSTNYAASAGGLTTAAKNSIISSAVNKVSSVNYASSALVASGLTYDATQNMITSASAAITSVIYATSASVAQNLVESVKNDIIASATSAPITSVASAGVAESITDELKSSIITSAVAAVPAVTSVASASVAEDIVASVKSSIITSAVESVQTYTGPFFCHEVNGSIVVDAGIVNLGGSEVNIPATSVASSNGNVYFYLYYSNNVYHSGVEIAASAGALTNAADVTGSAGYYTALAKINTTGIQQYQYGNIDINGRVQ